MEWNMLRFHLFQALDSIDIHEIYLIERDENVLTLCIIVNSGMEKIRPLTRLRIIDELIARNAPELYAQYLFAHEVWLRDDWNQQRVAKVWERKDKTLLR